MSKISKEGYEQITIIKNALDSMYDKLNQNFYIKNDPKNVKDIEKLYTPTNVFDCPLNKWVTAPGSIISF